MRLITRRKKQPAKMVDTVLNALKLGALIGAVRGATKGAGKGTRKGAKRVAKRAPSVPKKPIVLAAGGAGAAALVAKKLRSNGTTAEPERPPVSAAPTPG